MGWLLELLGGHRGVGSLEAQDAAQAAARSNILANADRDRARARRSEEQAGQPTARWRRREGVWERWSELEAGFAAAEPPEALLGHASRSGITGDVELVLVDGTWRSAVDPLDHSRAAAAGADPEEAVPVSPPPLPPPPPPPGDTEPSAADFEAQLEAWRRRRR